MNAAGILDHLRGRVSPGLDPAAFLRDQIAPLTRHRLHPLAARDAHAAGGTGTAAAEALLAEARARHAVFALGVAAAEALERAGIEHVILKGPAVWPFYPAAPFLRDRGDLDILVRPDAAAAARAALTAPWGPPRTVTAGAGQTALAFAGAGIPDVEVHTAVAPPYKNWIPPGAILDQAGTEVIGGVRLRVPAPAWRLFHAAIHAANHHLVDRLIWLYDIRFMLEAGVDTHLLQNAHGPHRRAVYAALHYTDAITGCPAAGLADGIRTSGFFRAALARLVPEDRIFDNPVSRSRVRRDLYNALLIQNPVNLFRAALR
ncbi:MAG: nucleotidyltransferase family protein [Planctomycetota bacterium]